MLLFYNVQTDWRWADEETRKNLDCKGSQPDFSLNHMQYYQP